MLSVYVICWIFLQTFQTYFCIQANSVDPDQTAPRGAVWSGSTLFAKMTFKITSRWQSRRQLMWLAVYGLIWTCTCELVQLGTHHLQLLCLCILIKDKILSVLALQEIENINVSSKDPDQTVNMQSGLDHYCSPKLSMLFFPHACVHLFSLTKSITFMLSIGTNRAERMV